MPNSRVRNVALLGAATFIVAACGSNSSDEASNTANSNCKNPTKAAFVYLGPITDGGWTTSHELARQKTVANIEEKYGEGCLEATYIENIPYTEEMTQLHEQYVADGYDVLIDAATAGALFKPVCAANPEVACITTDGQPPIDENVVAVYPKHWQPLYLLGVAAGMLTKTNEIGYVGAFPVPTIVVNANAMAMGCQSVNPQCKMRISFIDSWYDPKKSAEAVTTLANVGADFLYNTTDDPSSVTVAQNRGLWAAGAMQPQSKFGPDRYVTADVWDWSRIYTEQISAVIDGTFEGGKLVMPSLEEGDLTLDDWGPNVPAAVKQKVAEVEQEMLDGKLNPFVGPISDQNGEVQIPAGEVLTDDFLYAKWDWLVEGISGTTN
jgi:simple sugar transport system substrate-binding protein